MAGTAGALVGDAVGVGLSLLPDYEMATLFGTCMASLLELLYPEHCQRCGAGHGEREWAGRGDLVPGLHPLDRPHLCQVCAAAMDPGVTCGRLPVTGVPVFAGCRTGPVLADLLGRWKYHGVRGLAWPIGALVVQAATEASRSVGPVDYLVPIPLHRRRQRCRGFNQADVLAGLVAAQLTIAAPSDILRRVRATAQQAKIEGDEGRQANVAGAFLASCQGRRRLPGRRVGVVDDLVTGGATGDAAVRALRAKGWTVSWFVAAGLSAACIDGAR